MFNSVRANIYSTSHREVTRPTASSMAPVISARLPAALIDLLAPRGAYYQPQDVTSLPIAAAAARRFHSLARTSSLAARTPLDAPSHVLHARQNTITSTIPGLYPGVDAGPDPGTVVGITLGSVAGFLLLLWLVYTCLSMGNRSSAVTETVSSYGTESVVTRKSRRRHNSRHGEYRSPPRRSETVEIRESHVFPAEPPPQPQPPPPQMHTDRVVMEESMRRTSTPQPQPPPPQMQMPPHRPPPGPPPRMVDDDDEVVVIEEHTPPRKHRSQRHSHHSHKRRSSSARRERESGYRDVDPDRFAGGETTLRDVRRSSRHGR